MDVWGRIRHNLRVLEVEVCLGTRVARVVLATVDGEGRGFRVGIKFDRECRLRSAGLGHSFRYPAIPSRVPVSCDRREGESIIQSVQVRRRDLLDRLNMECLNSPRKARHIS